MINILILESSRNFGGQEKRMLDFPRLLDPARFTVHVGAQKDSRLYLDREALGVEVRPFRLRAALDLVGIAQVVRYIWKHRIGLLITYSGPDSWIGLIASWVTGVPILRMKTLRLLKHTTSYNCVDRVIVPGDGMRAFLVEGGVREEQVEVVHPGIDTTRFRFTSAAREEVRGRHGIGPDEQVLVCVSFLRRPKGQHLVLEALGKMASRPRLILVGATEGGYYEELRETCRREGLEGRVIFAGAREDVPGYLSAADVFVFPSRSEAFPRVVIEAFACGLPVIAADIPGTREAVERSGMGDLVPLDDAGAIASSADAWLADGPRRRDIRGTGPRWAAERFSLERSLGRFSELFEEIGRPMV